VAGVKTVGRGLSDSGISSSRLGIVDATSPPLAGSGVGVTAATGRDDGFGLEPAK
jgi:hypothetical protein